MREIKFRAWDGKNKEWIYSEPMPDMSFWKWVSYDSSTIFCEWIGLKDKNGVEIYEGDFLEDSLYVAWCDKQGGFQAFLPDDYCMACNGDMHWYEVVEDSNRYEVIGNIYENPDLLNSKEASTKGGEK